MKITTRRLSRRATIYSVLGTAVAAAMVSPMLASAASPHHSARQRIIQVRWHEHSGGHPRVAAPTSPASAPSSSAAAQGSAPAGSGSSPAAPSTPAATPTASPTTSPTAASGGAAAGQNGFRLWSNSSPWNTVKSALSFASGADSAIKSQIYGLNNGAYAHPVYYAKASDPLTTFKLGPGWGHPATTMTLHAPVGMRPAGGTDGELALVTTDGRVLDMYQASVAGSTVTAQQYGIADANGSGFGSAMYQAVGITGIGASSAGGVITANDAAAGVINHALAIEFDPSVLGGVGTSGVPALTVPSGFAVAYDNGNVGPIPEGGLLLIPAGTPKPAGLSRMGSALWDAASTYGAIVHDKCGGWAEFTGDGSSVLDTAFTASDLNAVGHALRLAKTW